MAGLPARATQPVHPAGARETIRFLPPLNVSEGEVDEALGIFEDSCAEVFG